MGVFFVMKTLEGERYVVIKAYKFTVFERFFFNIIKVHCMSALSLRIETTDSIITSDWELWLLGNMSAWTMDQWYYS